MKTLAPSLAGLVAVLSGCATIPANILALPASAVEARVRQTHRFADTRESELLAAGGGVCQDLGFTLEESEGRLGVLTASRKLTSRRPPNAGEIVAGVSYTLLVPYIAGPIAAYRAIAGIKEPQLVRVTLVTSSTGEAAGQTACVRVTAQRYIYTNETFSQVKSAEPLDDAKFYDEFFTRLEHSVSLEKEKNAL